jgi:hypothetical protein
VNGGNFGYRGAPKYDKAKLLRAALDLYGGPAILFVISTFILRDLCHISYLLTISSTVSRYSTEYHLIFVTFISLLGYIISNHSYCNTNTFTFTSKQEASFVVKWSEFRTTDHEIPGSIPGCAMGIFL